MSSLNKYVRKNIPLLLFGVLSLVSIITVSIAIKKPQSASSSAQEFPPHASYVKESLKGTKVALDAKNLEKYLVVESAILGVTDNLSLYFKDVNADKTISIDPTRSWIPASTIKAYVAVEAFRQQRIGLISFDQNVSIQSQNVVPTEMETPEFPMLQEGASVTIRQLVEDMVIQSDNIAYNTLLDILDRRNVNATLRDLGITETVVGEKLNLDDTQLQKDLTIPGRQPNTTTVKDYATLFDLLEHNQIQDSDKILSIFKRQKINSMIPALLPPNTPVAHKTGDWAPIFHDGGIVYKPNDPFVLVVFTNSNDQHVVSSMAKVAYDQTADAVGNSASIQKMVSPKTSESSPRRYLSYIPSAVVLGAETKNTEPQTYVAKSSDTFWSIAERFYGDGSRYGEIIRRNFLPDNASIEAGMHLIIPSSTGAPSDTANEKFPQITAADLGVKTADVKIDVTDAKKIQSAFIAPGSLLYPLKRFFEKQSITNTTSKSAKADAYIASSQKRLAEVKTLLAQGNTKDLSKLLSDSEIDLQAATDIIKTDKTLSSKLLSVKLLTDLHYALFADSTSGMTTGTRKQEIVDALYSFYTQNQNHVAPTVRTSVAANPTQQQPLIGTIKKVEGKVMTMEFDNGTTRDVPISQDTTVRDFHSKAPDVSPELQVGSKIAVVGEATEAGVRPLFILRNIPKGLPDRHEGTVLEVNPQKNSMEIINSNGKKEEVIVNDGTVVKGKDTQVTVGGITPGSRVTVFGEFQGATQSAFFSDASKSDQMSLKPSVGSINTQYKTFSTPINSKATPSFTQTPLSQTSASVGARHQQSANASKKEEIPIIKATSVTVTQNGSGKDVKQDSAKSVTTPPVTHKAATPVHAASQVQPSRKVTK